MKNRVFITFVSVILIFMIGGGVAGSVFGLFHAGNRAQYDLNNVSVEQNSPLNGKCILFLGSSVTFGYGSLGVSFVDYLQATNGVVAIKEAVSGTTLVDLNKNSYVSRLKSVDKELKLDAFVCQLSTNDATKELPLGVVSNSVTLNDFDTQTVAGAIEYIICYVRKNWNCPVVFYTQAAYDSAHYEKMVQLLYEIQKKWNIVILDLWNNEEVNSLTEHERELYLLDHIHPTKAGYKEWWLSVFRECLSDVIKESE